MPALTITKGDNIISRAKASSNNGGIGKHYKHIINAYNIQQKKKRENNNRSA
jgi:hypothetical protein